IAGIALVTVGLVNFSQQSGLPLPQEVMFKTVSLGVLVDGLLLLILEVVALFAQLPVGKRNLIIFAALLTFLVICETFFVFFVVTITATTRQDIFETVSSYVIRYYADNTSQASMDQLQNQLKCCGVYMDSDYIPKAPETCLDQNRVTYTRGSSGRPSPRISVHIMFYLNPTWTDSTNTLVCMSAGFSTVAPFRCLAAMSREGSTRAGILPGCPSLDRRIREAEVGFETRTFRSVDSRSNH
ncbi:hypothetical protein CSKR_108574, partial [Clonorchis sinensis]